MFGTWISQIQGELRSRFPASRDYRPADFKRAPMPESVAHFLEHALLRRAAVLEIGVDEEWFDVTAPAVVKAELQWRQALAEAGRYPASVWERSIDQAVGHVISFLVSPADSFCDFVFSNVEGDVHPQAILSRLAYFRSYSALRGVIKGYAERKDGVLVAREDLRAAMLKADRSITANLTPEEWVSLMKPLFELASVLAQEDEAPAVPTSVLKPVFEAKAADELVRRIEAVESIGGRRLLSESSLLTILGPTEMAADAPEAESDEPSGEDVSPPKPVQLNDIHAPAPSQAVPRWMQFTTAVNADAAKESGDGGPMNGKTPQPASVSGFSDNTPTSAVSAAVTSAEAIPQVHSESAETGESFDPTAEAVFAAPLQVGRRAAVPDDFQPGEELGEPEPEEHELEQRVLGDINAVQRAWFVNHLFQGNQIDFQRVIQLLDRAKDWEEASEVIEKEVFDRNRIDIYSQPAVEFTNVVESRFL